MISSSEKRALLKGRDIYKKRTGETLFPDSILRLSEISPANRDLLIESIDLILTRRGPDVERGVLKKLKKNLVLTKEDPRGRFDPGPTFPSALIGFRNWGYSEIGGELYLTSMFNHLAKANYRDLWHPGVNHAICHGMLVRDEVFPHHNHECGFNAFKTVRDAKAFKDKFRSIFLHPSSFLTGTILGFGQAQIHDTGWRSEKALPLALLVPPKLTVPGQGRKIHGLADKYNLELFQSERDLLRHAISQNALALEDLDI